MSSDLKRLNLWLTLSLTVVISINAQFLGIPQLRSFPFTEYGAGGQNYQLVSASDGFLYVANNFGLLQYNGNEWKRYPIPGGTKIRSLLYEETGKIFIGAQNELGYFMPTENGDLIYTSLKDKIPFDYNVFEDVWKIHQIENKIVFSTTGHSYLWDGDEMRVIESSENPGFTLSYQGRMITKPSNKPLVIWKDNQWVPMINQPDIAEAELIAIISLSDSAQLWATRKNGIIRFENGVQSVFSNSYSKLLEESTITTVESLSDGSIAVGTQSAGLLVFNSQGGLMQHFDRQTGLNSLTVNDVTQDENGVVWLALNNSIVKIHWTYPFSYIDEKMGVPGTGYSSLIYQGNIFLGTNNGLYYGPITDGRIAAFRQVEGLTGQINNLQEIDGQLIIAAHEGIFQWTSQGIHTIDMSSGWWKMTLTPDGAHAIGGSYKGLSLLENKNGRWELKKELAGFSESSRVLEWDRQGKLWMAHGYKGIFSIQFSASYDEIKKVKYYNDKSGLPSPYLNNVFKIKNELLFGTEAGMFSFDETQQSFYRHPYFDTLIGPNLHTRFLKENNQGDVYVLTNQYGGVLKYDQWQGFHMDKKPFAEIFKLLNDDLVQLTILENDQVLFTANTGFIHYHPQYGSISQQLETRIKTIEIVHADSILMDNYTGAAQLPVSIPYLYNGLNFRYTAFNNQFEETMYSVRLEGYRGGEWSDWSPTNSKEFINLYEGKYTFQVKSRDAFGNVSPPANYQFIIMPPWYRSTLAYIAYVSMFIGTFFISFFFYRRYHKKERNRLIENQKQEMNQKDSELTQLKNDKLETEVSLKKRQLASSTMHLIDKNDLLSKLKSQLGNIASADDVGKSASRELKRLTKEIDKNIDQDKAWDQFELHFDEVHGDFLKRLGLVYNNLTPQEVKLAAYLRMNMSTKEIANLLKISVRGVEIARYRLRKKLNLGTGQNLVDFMIKF